MYKFSLVMFAIMPISALSQSVRTQAVHTECPAEARQITPLVYSFRIYTPGVEGWRPESKMALDLRVRNTSSRGIAAMSFEIGATNNPRNDWNTIVLDRYDNVLLNANPGDERALYFPGNGGPLLTVYPTLGFVTVHLTELRYADGEIVDLTACNLGFAPVPPPFKPVKPASPSPIYPVGGEVWPSRVLEQHVMDEQNSWRGPPASIVLSFVVEVDGSPQDIEVDSSTLSAELNQRAIETLRTWNFAPAMMGDKPVATRTKVQFKFGR